MIRPRSNHPEPRSLLPIPCEGCGYDLRGSTTFERCPECGAKIRARSSSALAGQRIDAVHQSGLTQLAASQIGSFVPLAGFLLIQFIGPILAILTAFGPLYRLLALQLRYRTSTIRRFEPSGFGTSLLTLAWLESLAALAVVATLLGVIPAAAWPWTTLVYTMAAMLSVTTTNFFVAQATADWGSTIAPKVFFFGGMAALLAGAIAIGGRLSLALVANQSAAAIGFIVALVLAGILAAIAVAIARDGIARVESVLGNELLESERIPTDHAGSSIRVSAPAHPADLAPLPLEPERPPIRRSRGT